MQVDFYLMNNSGLHARLTVACKLAEKAYARQHKILVLCDNKATAHQFDELLWTLREDSFIPHLMINEGVDAPVQISFDEIPKQQRDILINLSASMPAQPTQFRRILELVPNDDDAKPRLREHYRHYQSLGAKLNTHHIA